MRLASDRLRGLVRPPNGSASVNVLIVLLRGVGKDWLAWVPRTGVG